MAKSKAGINAVLIVLIVAALASFSIACGKQETVEQQTQVSEEQIEETTATVQATEAETKAQASKILLCLTIEFLKKESGQQ